jgi:hypothetical protein
MTQPSKLITIFSKPYYQATLIAGMIILFTLFDFILPHPDSIFEVNAGPWIVATAMILCYVILNTLVALRVEPIIPYVIVSVILFFALLAFSYLWCYMLSGKHIDDVGSFRWLWFVLALVYMVFFAIARSMKRIVDIANKQDKRLRGEE